jgi:hypothetical protein
MLFCLDRAVSGKVLRLARARSNKAGAFWFRDKQSVRSGFESWAAGTPREWTRKTSNA